MEHVYPPGPAAVPPNLTAATAAYKRHAWLAMLGLAAFIALYFALSAFFAWTAWRLFSGMFGMGGSFELWGFIAAIGSAFLAVFMLKALVFIQHRYEIDDIEITRAGQPHLFEFIDRLADEARAPRAHKVYLSPRVNAAVFYDLSLLNLIVPSKKNLEIGLGLVNVVTLGEFKAVLAHEFGHFAQRSMAVGRWVYISQQIAGHVVSRRDALDKFLKQLSRLDLRVAWIGWLLSIIVWSIRSMMEVVFRLVLIAQRALSRQMEFQADLVAVSLTGSDALIHALHKLNAADDAWDKTMDFANTECGKKRGVKDLFAVQTRIIERMREILNQPSYGAVPPLPATARETHRVFKMELAQPPRMWATHPPSADREANAKQRYVAADVDDRSAWQLFRDPQALKDQMSSHVFRNAEVESTPPEKTAEQLEKEYGRPYLNPGYRGTYLNRSPVRHADTAAALYGPPVSPAELPRVLDSLYPPSLSQDVEQLNEKLEEKHALEALRDSQAQAPGGIIRHQGRSVSRAELPRVIAALDRDVTGVRQRIEAHDRTCRTAHLAAARVLQKGWPEYLQGLAAALHYADHCEANLRDVQGYVGNIYGVVTADGRVSSNELARLIEGCQQLYRVLQAIYTEMPQILLDRTLTRRLEVENWTAMLEAFQLPPPNRENIGQWLEVIDGWVGAARHSLSRLRTAALEQLLLAESQVSRFVRDKLQPADAPPATVVPREFLTLMPGKERPRQKRLDWWDRFQTADGVVPAIARSVVAVGIVGSVVALGAQVGTSTLTIYNALASPVVVWLDGERFVAESLRPLTAAVSQSGSLDVRATTQDGREIEHFEQKISGANAKYVYNVAGAAPLYHRSVVYYPNQAAAANREPPPVRHLGAARWQTASSFDHMFEEPPESIETSSGGNTYREVLGAAIEASPGQQASLVTDVAERSRMTLAHARWDSTESPRISDWLELAARDPSFDALLADRLKQSSTDVVLGRFEQDFSQGAKHDEVCARHIQRSAATPQDPDLLFLAIRCAPGEAEQNARFIAGHEQWPQHPWFTYAAGGSHADAGDYAKAEPLYDEARRTLNPMREYLNLEIARLRRLNGHGEPAALGDLANTSSYLASMLAIESGEAEAGSPLEPYAMIANARLDDAARLAKAAGDDGHRLLRLIATSDGATAGMIEDALALPVAGEDGDLVVMMYALAARNGRSTAPFETAIRATAPQTAEGVVRFLESLKRGEDPARARAALPSLRLSGRLNLLYAGVLLLGPNAPAEWRREVERGLFVGERGYLAQVRSDRGS
jgi:Zn-dependent protease with chaperone function